MGIYMEISGLIILSLTIFASLLLIRIRYFPSNINQPMPSNRLVEGPDDLGNINSSIVSNEKLKVYKNNLKNEIKELEKQKKNILEQKSNESNETIEKKLEEKKNDLNDLNKLKLEDYGKPSIDLDNISNSELRRKIKEIMNENDNYTVGGGGDIGGGDMGGG